MAKINRKQLAATETKLAAVKTALAAFQASHTEGQDISDLVTDAWNSLHDAQSALEAEITDLNNPRRPIPSHEMGTYALAQQNID